MRKSIAAYGSLYQTRSAERGVKRFPTGIPGLDRALNGGVLLFIVGMFTVTNDLKNEQRNRRVSYKSYRNKD